MKPIKVNDRFFNCGKCINCRINYTRMWSLRLMYELSEYNAASFLTLTLDNNHLPENNSLDKRDLQLFFKRLRRNLELEYGSQKKIKYYAVGEYGSTELKYFSPGALLPHGRPHYHAIVFGLNDLDDKERAICADSWPFCESWMFDKSRGRLSAMQEVTPDDIQYVTGYVQKKLSGEKAKEEYGEAQAPFSLCSQGLGKQFCLDNSERLIQNGWTYFKGHPVSLPRYFADKLGIKRSDYIKEDYSLKDKLEVSTSELIETFKKDMIKRGTYYPENPTMLEHRFELWYERREFEYSKQIYNDFLARRKLLGSKL